MLAPALKQKLDLGQFVVIQPMLWWALLSKPEMAGFGSLMRQQGPQYPRARRPLGKFFMMGHAQTQTSCVCSSRSKVTPCFVVGAGVHFDPDRLVGVGKPVTSRKDRQFCDIATRCGTPITAPVMAGTRGASNYGVHS
jgi:hypothetical protein